MSDSTVGAEPKSAGGSGDAGITLSSNVNVASYEGVLLPDDLLLRGSPYDSVIVDAQGARSAMGPSITGEEISWDPRNAVQKEEDSRYDKRVAALRSKYSWFDPRHPGAWQLAEASERAEQMGQLNYLFDLLNEVSKGRLYRTYDLNYQQIISPVTPRGSSRVRQIRGC
jgi:hypothetical protein